MRAINLLPPELRTRTAGEGDPRVAYGIVGGLALLLLMVIVAVMYSNKATTLNAQAEALNAKADRARAQTVRPVQSFNDFAGVAQSRTLLVGGLAASRFPWGTALYNLSRSLPEDVTLNDINALTVDQSVAATNQASGATVVASSALPSLTLTGCTSGWIGYSRLLVWLKEMPGVASVNSTQSTSGGVIEESTDADNRTENCGPSPLQFSLVVAFEQREVDLVGLPKVEAAAPAGASGPTGAEASAEPAAQTTPEAGG